MSDLAPQLFVNVLFAGALQVTFALPVAGVACLLRQRREWLRRFTLFNLSLFIWSIFGCAAWLLSTENRLAVLDDAPVWAVVFPFGRVILDHAAGGNGGWQLLGGTSLAQLQFAWALTASAVWLLASLSLWSWRRIRVKRPPYAPA